MTKLIQFHCTFKHLHIRTPVYRPNPKPAFRASIFCQFFPRNQFGFQLVAIRITCHGWFGLPFLSEEKSVKQIGVRKILGVSVSRVFSFLPKHFLKLVIIAHLVTVSMAWFASQSLAAMLRVSFIQNMAVSLLAGFIAVQNTLVTVIVPAMIPAAPNPVESLGND